MKRLLGAALAAFLLFSPLAFAMQILSQTPTISTSAYTAGDAVGGKLTFSGAPDDGVIETVTIIDKDEEGAALALLLFAADFTATADADAFDITAGEETRLIGIVPIAAADYVDAGGVKIATLKNLGIGYHLSETSTTKRARIYGQLVTTGTPTYTATDDLVVQIAVGPEGR